VSDAYGIATSIPVNLVVNPSSGPSDTPTLPEWGLVLLGALLFLAAARGLAGERTGCE
jgi:hypothetical protein